MTDLPLSQPAAAMPGRRTGSLLAQDDRTRRRNAAEGRFRLYGVIAIAISMIALVVLLATILTGGAGAFRQTYLNIPVTLDAEVLARLFEGVYGCFVNTNTFEGGAVSELATAFDIVRRSCAVRSGSSLTPTMQWELANWHKVRHLVWSNQDYAVKLAVCIAPDLKLHLLRCIISGV